MNVGELKDKISVMKLKRAENTYTWEPSSYIWSKVERLNGNNLFSKVGIGVKSSKFTIRKNATITLHNAFKWQGKHCFLTDIVEINRMYCEVTAALIEPVNCSISRDGKPALNDLNRPVYEETTIITFPGCLTEKYLGHTQGNPMATTETTYVLVVPKAITLNVGELVTIGDIPYTITIPHTLDEFKNEYEITAKGDA